MIYLSLFLWDQARQKKGVKYLRQPGKARMPCACAVCETFRELLDACPVKMPTPNGGEPRG